MKQEKVNNYKPNYPKNIIKGTALTLTVMTALGTSAGCKIIKPIFDDGPSIEGLIAVEPTHEVIEDGYVAIDDTENDLTLSGDVAIDEPDIIEEDKDLPLSGVIAYDPEFDSNNN